MKSKLGLILASVFGSSLGSKTEFKETEPHASDALRSIGREPEKVEPKAVVTKTLEISETVNGLTVGLAYVMDIAGSQALLWLTKFSKTAKYVWAFGFDYQGNFNEYPELYDISHCNFQLADKNYINKRIEEYETELKNRALYSASGSDVKYMQGGFYAGVKGKKTFFVVKDNKNLTYDIVTMDKNNKEVRSTVFFDKTARQLNKQQAGAYVKKLAVNRGFTRTDLSFGIARDLGVVLTGFNDLPIWINGYWRPEVLSRTEAEEIISQNMNDLNFVIA